jgi:simple sugar transport system ATP-binding protein
MESADRITVLRDGKNVGTLPAGETTRNELARLMVGREVLMEVDKQPGTFGDRVLDVDGVSVRDERGVPTVRDVSLSVRAGEIFGIAGVDGNGQSELVESITGLREPNAGRVRLDGTDVTDWSRRERIDGGMAYVPEDRHERGLVMEFDLVGNGILGSQHASPFATDGRIDWERAREHAGMIVDEYDVRPPDPSTIAESLSGGNQQKFIVGRELERAPKLMVATHPTRGVDIGSTEFIHERLLDLRSEGVAVLLVSSKLEEVQGLSDRLGVMHDGRIVDVVDPEAVTEEELGLLMAGEEIDRDVAAATESKRERPAEPDGGQAAPGSHDGDNDSGPSADGPGGDPR